VVVFAVPVLLVDELLDDVSGCEEVLPVMPLEELLLPEAGAAPVC
jgi:hypothetical protein